MDYTDAEEVNQTNHLTKQNKKTNTISNNRIILNINTISRFENITKYINTEQKNNAKSAQNIQEKIRSSLKPTSNKIIQIHELTQINYNIHVNTTPKIT